MASVPSYLKVSNSDRRSPFFPHAGHYPAGAANSYLPFYQTPQTIYGSCVCIGGGIRSNNCNFQQNGMKPVCYTDGNCKCVSADGADAGCFNTPGASCL